MALKLISEAAAKAHNEILGVFLEGAAKGKSDFEYGRKTLPDLITHTQGHTRNLHHCIDTGKKIDREDITHVLTDLAMLLAVYDAEGK